MAMGIGVRRAMNEKGDGCAALGDALGLIGDKWTIVLVGVLSSGPARFNALRRAAAGISHRMLTTTLRSLEREGIVQRTDFSTKAPHVEYELTALGRTLIAPLTTLAAWARDNRAAMAAARTAFEQRGP